MSILSAYRKVRPAVLSMDQSAQSHILVKDGYMTASNLAFTVSTPVDLKGEFLAPGSAFKKAVEIIGDDEDSIKIHSKKLVLSAGAHKADVPLLVDGDFAFREFVGKPTEVPEGLRGAIMEVLPFISDDQTKTWACAIWLKDGVAYATNNVAAAAASFGDCTIDLLIPDYLARFIVEINLEIIEIAHTETSICLRFADGTWCRAARPAQQMPERVVEMIASVPAEVEEMKPNWVLSLQQALAIASELVIISPDSIRAGRTRLEFEAAIKSSVEADTMWHPKFLSPVIAASHSFDPGTWPKPSPFRGPNIRGLIMGKQS